MMISHVTDDLHRDGLNLIRWKIFFLPSRDHTPEAEVNVYSSI